MPMKCVYDFSSSLLHCQIIRANLMLKIYMFCLNVFLQEMVRLVPIIYQILIVYNIQESILQDMDIKLLHSGTYWY